MGEYATYAGESIKIGTCESMYYLRAADRGIVSPESGSLDPVSCMKELRFRFPLPSEDGMQPGSYESHEPRTGRFNWVSGGDYPDKVEHYSIQLSSPKGLLASIPCPVGGKKIEGLTVHKNGYAGDLCLDSIAHRDGSWVVVLRCVCGSLFWVPNEERDALLVGMRTRELHELADRVTQVYLQNPKFVGVQL